MKLKNKKTGEVKEWDFGNWYQHIMNPDNKESYECTLSEFIDRTAEFRKEWEDVPEEAKEYWYIDCYGEVLRSLYNGNEWDERRKLIGNYFKTKEEAELAVRKLKAWKRLKDKGFRPKMWEWEYIYDDNISGELIIKAHIDDATDSDGKYTKDLDLLFGGKG